MTLLRPGPGSGILAGAGIGWDYRIYKNKGGDMMLQSILDKSFEATGTKL